MRYIKLTSVVAKAGGGSHPYTTADVIRHFLDTEQRFLGGGPGVRQAVAIDTALAEAEEVGATWIALEDAPFEALLAACEKPEKGYPDVAAFNRQTGEIIQRFPVVRQLGPILNAIFDAPKTRPADFEERAPKPPVEAAPVPASVAAQPS
jgi:hypothetical protein